MLFQMNSMARQPNYTPDVNRSADERVRALEQQLQDRNSAVNGGTTPSDDVQQRIDRLEQQLRSTRADDDDDQSDDNTDSAQRIEDLERRMMDRMDDLRDNTNTSETDAIRAEMMRDMADYQSEMTREIRSLQRDLDRANRELAQRNAQQDNMDERIDLERDRLRQERRAARLAAATTTTVDSAGNRVIVPGTRSLDELEISTGGVYVADGNAEGFFSNFTYTGMSGTVGFNFGDATGLGLGLRWHYKLGPDQRAEFMPEAYFGIGSPTTFGIFGNIVYPIITERSQANGIIPYAGIGVGAMQIQDQDNSDELNFRPAINLLIGSYLPVGNGRVFVDFSTRNFFSVNQLTGGYRFNF